VQESALETYSHAENDGMHNTSCVPSSGVDDASSTTEYDMRDHIHDLRQPADQSEYVQEDALETDSPARYEDMLHTCVASSVAEDASNAAENDFHDHVCDTPAHGEHNEDVRENALETDDHIPHADMHHTCDPASGLGDALEITEYAVHDEVCDSPKPADDFEGASDELTELVGDSALIDVRHQQCAQQEAEDKSVESLVNSRVEHAVNCPDGPVKEQEEDEDADL